ncbi:hypothetical protein ACO2Q8_14905 [Larkinella sp. VNQ87]|uniref:hypothetical protein n=1 Tax=Larkinella sp. VNQ87 TaxID=3400921 RepID=UPI003C10699C
MGVGIEMIFFVLLLAAGGFIIYRMGFRGKSRLRRSDFTRPGSGPLRVATITAAVALIVAIALTLEFCSEQQNRMDKNTHEDSSLDNVGKGENEPGAGDEQEPQ